MEADHSSIGFQPSRARKTDTQPSRGERHNRGNPKPQVDGLPNGVPSISLLYSYAYTVRPPGLARWQTHTLPAIAVESLLVRGDKLCCY
ncbi:unnamed protein product [Macrosiphum euphorbiae]|uniref:Uncharacterized protein n=1 Tax=Macrosiphum euphorbiae TaxID=13131 RepID=A0AAV0XC53_9HEMI|nr:unnamed protein product [Macrosiphum euphorbiae]